MAAKKKIFVCISCGVESAKWAGQCPGCGQWDCLQETLPQSSVEGFAGYSGARAEVQLMSEVSLDGVSRLTTGLQEFDRVLGGGLVQGSVVLVGGDPGVGKSTGLLQVCGHLCRDVGVLYVSGEESPQQIAGRARRLGVDVASLHLRAETRVELICEAANRDQPKVMVIDSIQTMQAAGVSSAPGSVSQVRESAARLTRFAKENGVAVLLVGHVTKTGDLAGPRVLEHIIDVVCYIEGERDSRFRIFRAVKNRYGAVNELGVFAMTDKGLQEIRNPSAIFLSRSDKAVAGSVIMVIWEGTRPLLVEIQSLVDESHGETPRRIALGLEQNRLAMLLAVLHRHGRVATYNQDVFINVVGGIKVNETSADLALLMAIVSSMENFSLPQDLVIFGEVGLTGEIRPVSGGQERLQEAAKHGFKQAIVPVANTSQGQIKGIRVNGVATVSEALAAVSRLVST